MSARRHTNRRGVLARAGAAGLAGVAAIGAIKNGMASEEAVYVGAGVFGFVRGFFSKTPARLVYHAVGAAGVAAEVPLSDTNVFLFAETSALVGAGFRKLARRPKPHGR